MSKWDIIRVNDLVLKNEADLQTGPFGTQLKASEYVADGIPVINVRNIGYGSLIDSKLEFVSEQTAVKLKVHRLDQGDIVFGRKGAVDRHILVTQKSEKWIQGSDCLRLRIKSKDLSNKFLSYYFTTDPHKSWMEAQGSFGATMSSLNQDIVKRINIPLPPLSIQKKIAAVLSAYDDLIENNDRRIALLEKMAEEIYREWFVRLRFPGHEQVTFHKGIPEGWEMVQLGDIVKDIIDYRGITPGKLNSDWQNEGIAALSALNIKKGKLIRIEDSKCVSEELFDKWMRKKLDRLDILLTSEAPLGEVYILMKKEKYVLSQRLFAIRANPKKIQPIYLYYYLLCEVGQYELTSKATGSTVGGIRQALLRKVGILKPTNLFQEKFASTAEPILENIYKLCNKNNLLKQTRDRLLTRLISGKLSVEDLDIQFPPSMTTDL
jgi:type I restriction enzyme, S subunit